MALNYTMTVPKRFVWSTKVIYHISPGEKQPFQPAWATGVFLEFFFSNSAGFS